jgi:TPR repeat protein
LSVFLLGASCATAQQRLDISDLRTRAENGDNAAAVGMGLLYEGGIEVQRNLAEAAKWYRLAADRGYAEAQNSLGSMYQAGEGVPRDYGEALRWYSLGADQGHAVSLRNLGYMYDLGLSVPEDNSRAATLYTQAAEKGDIQAMVNLGVMLGQGEPPVERDVVRAFMWLDLARFYTQGTKDMKLKWSVRGALDQLRKQMSSQQIARGEELTKEWDAAHRRQ